MGKEKFKLSKAELNKAWKEGFATKDEFAGGEVYEDGRYKVALTAADRYESKASGRDQVMFEFTFLEGDYKGKTKRDYNGLDRAESVPFLIRKIEAMGFDAPEEADDLEPVLKKMVKARPQFVVQLKTKGDFQNVYIQKSLDEAETVELPPESAAPAKEEAVRREAPEAAAPAEEEQVDIEVGLSVVCFDEKGEEEDKGEIVAINEKDEEITVKNEKGKKVIYPVSQIAVAPKPEPVAKPKLKLRK